MRKFYPGLVFLGVVIIGVILFASSRSLEYYTKNILIGEVVLAVEIADTDEKRTLGLSGRRSLGEDEGMLFVFDAPGYYKFWMPNMNFPIDIIWIDENKKIVSITPNAQPLHPDDKLVYYTPQKPAMYVLEVNAGWSKKNNIKSRNLIQFNS